ncbi:MAG: 3-hydroxyacyl-ACP dehydratase FabZ [Waddliaceae bacterium]|jgi:3-hydroxyacyl-[acyl-carrier-protein] dehydratase|nr:3-hydroxyacyl-ACP dehydratase FabZ [Waddliaceae bacterium]MBT3578665.1 3-hydroxyacyl-ACP dehydratase FabZ [Waddliaceae bacterium]MBT4445384.1 3-hydroxyacyl-ACP dehydratase FabZ [Waddliaceae bacterium]MBT6928348.1 3-hydroxyacyl-ACP dehydratase FabZ [Waddliaceae bacterium]MBT7265034.1 3-hydroxyacyl-ACP dehydratase FabZ [Waddliaceae bacterium]
MSYDTTVLDIKDLMSILPHRYPFLLIDKVVELDLEKNVIVGQKNVTINEEFFQGHFPGAPIMPGVLILEALAQTGSVLVSKKVGNDGVAVLLKISNAKFRRPVHPGDVLYLHVEGQHLSDKGGRVLGKAIVDEKTVVEAEISFAFVDKKNI